MATKKRSGSHIQHNRPSKRQKLSEHNQTYQTNVIEYKNYLNCLLQIISLTVKNHSSIIKDTGQTILKINELEKCKSSINNALIDDNILSYETLADALLKVSALPTKYKELYCGGFQKYILNFPHYDREYKTMNDVPFILSTQFRYIQYQKKRNAIRNDKEITEIIVLSDSETEENQEINKINELQKDLSEMEKKCGELMNENNKLKNMIHQIKSDKQSKEIVIKLLIQEKDNIIKQKDNILQKIKCELSNHMNAKEILNKELLAMKNAYIHIVEKYETIKNTKNKTNEIDTLKNVLKQVNEKNIKLINEIENKNIQIRRISISKNKLQIICSALQSQMIKGHEPRREFIQPTKCTDGIERTQTVKQWKLNVCTNILITKHDKEISKSMRKKLELYLRINKNDKNYINPITTNKLLLNKTLERFTITLSHRSPSLEGQYGIKALCNIPRDTILSQYVGFEMTNEEWNKCFDYSNRDMINGRYLYTFDLDKKENGNGRSVTIDPMEGGKSESLVLYINDCRKDVLEPKMTVDDEKHKNCKFLVARINGWPTVFVVSVKKIRKGQELFIDYGKDFWLLSNESNRWNRMIEKVKQLSEKNIIKNVKIHDVHNGIECHDLTQ